MDNRRQKNKKIVGHKPSSILIGEGMEDIIYKTVAWANKNSPSVRPDSQGQDNGFVPQEEGVFEGYASYFGVQDADNDSIQKGAFFQAVQDFNKRTFIPKLLWQHKTDELLGMFLHMEEDDNGLKIRGKLLLDLPKAREVYTLLKEGIIRGLSVGFVPILCKKGPGKQRKILHARLYEISLVTFPSNPRAEVHSCKSYLQGSPP